MDAYRRLAEQVKGVQVSSNTKVLDYITRYDDMRTVVDSYIVNAKVVSQNFTGEGYCETTLSLQLDSAFFKYLQVVRERRFGAKNNNIEAPLQGGGHLDQDVAITLSNDSVHYDLGVAFDDSKL